MAINPLYLDFYGWRQRCKDEDDSTERLIIPHSNPQEYEDPLDAMFPTPEAAQECLVDLELADEAAAEGWVLVHFLATIVANLASAAEPALKGAEPRTA